MAWDSQCLVVVGVDHRDLALAADRLIDVLTTAAIPHLRPTERGYVHVKDGALLGLYKQ